MTTPTDFELPGAFYLGRLRDSTGQTTTDAPLVYPAKDLTTHAVCVGMTGSGKTGLGITLVEEAALDGVPVILIDPKGDLSNLLLTFPDLDPDDFRPWLDADELARKGLTPEQGAEKTAATWRKGLAAWGEDGDRIARLRAAADFSIYTPGAKTGLPLSLLSSLDAPPPGFADDPAAMRDRVSAAVSGVLALAGIDADPVQSREHILLSAIVDRDWRTGRSIDLARLIQAIQEPGLDRIGVLPLESFFPAKDRFALAMRLNNLMASPSFAAWTEGEPLDIARLLRTPDGRPRVTILSISHLQDAERMFFVTVLLNEVLAWARRQSGTSSLRAILYMDEIFGYFPPNANPPSKAPMLTLLKQARAYGLGIVLATQNPVDLDYRGLANTGTWFIGRLQTERDKMRVIEGLTSAVAGEGLDRATLDRLMANLKQRVFMMRNAHDDAPVLFESRWCMSYLRGPLSPAEITRLMARKKALSSPAPASAIASQPPSGSIPSLAAAAPSAASPVLPTGGAGGPPAATPAGTPYLRARVRLHYVSAKHLLDHWATAAYAAPIAPDGNPLWDDLAPIPEDGTFDDAEPILPPGTPAPALSDPKQRPKIERLLKSQLRLAGILTIYTAPGEKLASTPGETREDFLARAQDGRGARKDAALKKLTDKHNIVLRRLKTQQQTAQARVETEEAQLKAQRWNFLATIGTFLLSLVGFLGGKGTITSGAGRAKTTIGSMSRSQKEALDIQHAKDKLQAIQDELDRVQADYDDQVAALESEYSSPPEITPCPIAPRPSDLILQSLDLLWLPR